jgi:TPR repeat protein
MWRWRQVLVLWVGGVVFAAALLAAAPVRADFNDGVKAYLAQDYDAALLPWRPLAEQGHAPAQFGLGLAYENGRGVDRSLERAASWYRKAAEQGLQDAQFNLGNLYLNGAGVEKDPVEAVRWFRRAADQGMPHAQVNLGYSYETGTGVARDPGEAVYWYREAARQNFAQAQYYLGAAYERGLGVTKDLSLAAGWYEKAAERGVTLAQNRLDVIQGKGVEPAEMTDLAMESEPPPRASPGVELSQTTANQAESDFAYAAEATAPVAETPTPAVEAPAPVVEAERPAETNQDGESELAATRAGSDIVRVDPVGSEFAAPATSAATASEAATATAEPGQQIASLEGSHRVRLASYKIPSNVEKGWNVLRKKHSALLGSLNYAAARVDLGPEKGVFFRLEAGPLGSSDESAAICAEIKRRGDSCLVVRP